MWLLYRAVPVPSVWHWAEAGLALQAHQGCEAVPVNPLHLSGNVIAVRALIQRKPTVSCLHLVSWAVTHSISLLFYSLLPENRRKKSRRETGVSPIVQALAPFSLGGCRAVIELVSRASLIGLLFGFAI